MKTIAIKLGVIILWLVAQPFFTLIGVWYIATFKDESKNYWEMRKRPVGKWKFDEKMN